MEDIIQLEDQFYIPTSSSRVDDRTRVLKQGDTFGVFDRYGEIHSLGRGDHGLYHKGTRFLSRFGFTLCGKHPLLLSSALDENNVVLSNDMTNPDMRESGCVAIPHGAIHIYRTKFIWEGVCYERLRVTNLSLQSVQMVLDYHIEADFADIFEVRGNRRPKKGKLDSGQTQGSEIIRSYEGLDGVWRRTRISFSPAPQTLTPTRIVFSQDLRSKGEAVFYLTVACEISDCLPRILSYDTALDKAQVAMDTAEQQESQIRTPHESFNAWLSRSLIDLRALTTPLPTGPYPYAGIPWFSTPFGRDGLITALQTLWLNPLIARGVLTYLAAEQATEEDIDNDAEPGKILHEAREGEMAALGEIPFGRYYGSVDSTPLFVILAGAYFERTADKSFIEKIWPNIDAALGWIDNYGDVDRDGFVEYHRRSANGLVQQGWKDSRDSVFHVDGSLAEGPIALCEVQGYVYLAKQKAAALASALGQEKHADVLLRQAARLKQHFEKSFWCEEIRTYAIALDGEKKACRVRSSNAGHCLFTGIAETEHAMKTAETLMSESSYSGWGIRTLDAREVRYNPMSYHNGSVWPHDNALIAAGLWRYGCRKETIQILTGLFEASKQVELHRLPELICGFHKRPHEGPTLYPTACSPQAWASGALLHLLPTILGMTIDASQHQICFTRPYLPSFLKEVHIQRLQIGDATLNVSVCGHEDNVDVHVEREKGSIDALVYK